METDAENGTENGTEAGSGAPGSEEPRIKPRDIAEEMRESYLDYAMSVIVARALPDVRDGLKPVHRRLLYSMNELGLEPSKGYKKSARIVGDTMGKYHPHGESSIYDAMVRMAQDFSMRYLLVDGHGNYGSMDGDGAAASRYTEAKLSRLSMEMLTDLDKDTVDFAPNYDNELTEPTVLPARFPNLLVNGSSGIAVGMSTNIPPHNLRDVILAVIKRIDDMTRGEETSLKSLIEIVKAPDFPTGGAILGTDGVRDAYRTGRGKAILRAEVAIEPMPGSPNREQLLVTAIPYQVNKSNLVKKIADLVKEKKVEGITDIRDESNRQGVRIVIELKRDANANVVLNTLYKLSSLQESFGIIMLALVKARGSVLEPRIMNLLEIIDHYIAHQQDVVTRRTLFDLDKAKRRAHILEALLKAQDRIDAIIALIRASDDGTHARDRLVGEFSFTEIQAQAIVDMRLRALTGLEKSRLEKEHGELQALIAELGRILSDGNCLLGVIKAEITKTMERFGDARRTAIVHDPASIDVEDLIDDVGSVVTLSHLGYVKRLPVDTYRSQARGGKGVVGVKTREEDFVKNLYVTNTHDTLLFFTSKGRAFSIRTFEIPEAGRQARGLPLVNMLSLGSGEAVAGCVPVAKNNWDGFLIFVTEGGLVSRQSLSAFSKINKSGLNAITFREDDCLTHVLRTDGGAELFVASKRGMGIRFSEAEVRHTGRGAMGVRAMKLREGDKIVGATVAAEGQVLLVSSEGYGKCTPISACRGQRRGGVGVKIYKATERTGTLVGVEAVQDSDGLMLINSEGVIIRIQVSDISVQGRIASGVRLIKMDGGAKVAGIAKIAEDCESGQG